ncbi:MAG: hypothetical protein Q3962_03380 [Corynebacterium sp.]|nr:hypothetical protein [Corynebacterium sp.]
MKSSNVFSPAMLAVSLLLTGVVVADGLSVPKVASAEDTSSNTVANATEARTRIGALFATYGKTDGKTLQDAVNDSNYQSIVNQAANIAAKYSSLKDAYDKLWNLFNSKEIAFDNKGQQYRADIAKFITDKKLNSIGNSVVPGDAATLTPAAIEDAVSQVLVATQKELTDVQDKANKSSLGTAEKDYISKFTAELNLFSGTATTQLSSAAIQEQWDLIIRSMSSYLTISTAPTDGTQLQYSGYSDKENLTATGQTYLTTAYDYYLAYYKLFLGYSFMDGTNVKTVMSTDTSYTEFMTGARSTLGSNATSLGSVSVDLTSQVKDLITSRGAAKDSADYTKLQTLLANYNKLVSSYNALIGAKFDSSPYIYLTEAQLKAAEVQYNTATTAGQRSTILTNLSNLNLAQQTAYNDWSSYHDLIANTSGTASDQAKAFDEAAAALLKISGITALTSSTNRAQNGYNEDVKAIDANQLTAVKNADNTFMTQVRDVVLENYYQYLVALLNNTNKSGTDTYYTEGQISAISSQLMQKKNALMWGEMKNLFNTYYNGIGQAQRLVYNQWSFGSKVKLSIPYMNAAADKKAAFDKAMSDVDAYFAGRTADNTTDDQNELNKLKMRVNSLSENINKTVLALDGTSPKQDNLNKLVDASIQYRATSYYQTASASQQARFDLALAAAQTVSTAKFPTENDIDTVSSELESAKDQLPNNPGGNDSGRTRIFAIVFAIIAFFAAVAVAGFAVTQAK